MRLDKAIKILKEEIEPKENQIAMELDIQAIETVLKALENSIPKKKIRDKIKKLKSRGRIINQTFPDCGEYIYHKEIKALKQLLEKPNE